MTHRPFTIILLFFCTIAGCSPTRDRSTLFADPTPQARQEREFRDFFGPPVDTLGLVGDSAGVEALFEPLSVVVEEQGAVFVLDRGDMRIKKYDRMGRFVRSFGKGVGQGPGEFQRLMGVSVNQAGELFALDGSHVTRFDSLGNVLNRFATGRQGDGIAGLPDGGVIVKLIGPGPLFGTFDGDGKPLNSEAGPSFDSIEESFPLVGQMVGTPAGDVVFSPYYAGFIASFNSELDAKYQVETIEPSPVPGVVHADGSFTLNKGLSRGLYVPASATSDTVYASFFSKERQAGYLDVYSNRDGSYVYSAIIPDECVPVAITESHAYLLCNQAQIVKVRRVTASTFPSGEVL